MPPTTTTLLVVVIGWLSVQSVGVNGQGQSVVKSNDYSATMISRLVHTSNFALRSSSAHIPRGLLPQQQCTANK